MPFTIRPNDPSDYSWLFELHHESYFDVITRQFGVWDEEEQRDIFLSVWRSENLTVVLSENIPIGMYIVNSHENHLWLAEFQITPKYQNKGFGSKIIQILLTNARQLNKPLRLRVLFKNYRAKAFYFRHGFISISQTNHHHVMQAG